MTSGTPCRRSISISLVYPAMLHENTPAILLHALRVAGWIVGFMAVIFVVLQAISWCVSVRSRISRNPLKGAAPLRAC